MNKTEQKRVGFVSLGCPKALVDSERILTQLKIEGYEITPHYEDAGVVIVNDQETHYDNIADVVLRGSITDVLPALLGG